MFLPAGYSTWVRDIDRHRGGAEHCSSDAILPGHRASVVDQSQWNAPMRSTNQIHRTLLRRTPIHQAHSQREKKSAREQSSNQRRIVKRMGQSEDVWLDKWKMDLFKWKKKIKWMRKSFSIDINYYVKAAASATHSLWPMLMCKIWGKSQIFRDFFTLILA